MRQRMINGAMVTVLGLFVLFGLFPLQFVGTVADAQVSVLNYFAQATGSDNILNIDGTVEYEDKATVIDHGQTTTANGYKSVTTNLSSNVTCIVALDTGATGDDPNYVTALNTTGSSTLEIIVWKNTSGTDPTYVQSTGAHVVNYVCFGAD